MQIPKKPLFTTIKTSKKPDEAYKQLVTMIRTGQIIPGDKLPSERHLSALLRISRQSVREAILRAENSGLVEVRHGEGCFVLSSIQKTLKSPLRLLLEEEAHKILEFLEIRRLIEAWCSYKAALLADAEDLHKMQEILERMEGIVPTDPKWAREDTDFHISIAVATKNVIAIHIMQALKETFESYFRIRKCGDRETEDLRTSRFYRTIHKRGSRKQIE
jgi:GntR family transcriptional repressor for pyruvate dehydrogenase complex